MCYTNFLYFPKPIPSDSTIIVESQKATQLSINFDAHRYVLVRRLGRVFERTNKAASRVLYRWYLEDLTVSGRTYAEVLAADYALYQQAFGVGGRYYGDTLPTDPSTIP